MYKIIVIILFLFLNATIRRKQRFNTSSSSSDLPNKTPLVGHWVNRDIAKQWALSLTLKKIIKKIVTNNIYINKKK